MRRHDRTVTDFAEICPLLSPGCELRLSGLEPMMYEQSDEDPRSTFLNIGERCNVAGSIMYKKAIVDGDYDKAHAIALKQASLPPLHLGVCVLCS